MQEKLLITNCINNKREAQKKLFEMYSNIMFTIAYRIINDYDMAHDILQDAFIEVFRDLKDFRNECPLFHWIKTIVVRKSILAIKSKNEFELLENQNHLPSPEFNAEFTAEDLDKAIRTLPVGTRSVFLLIEVEGYKHKEIAEMLNISIETSKSQLHYAKKLLRQQLKIMYDYEI